jgi:hypothetical protein
MATKFSTKIEKVTTPDYIGEVISVTGSVVSGTYPEPGSAGSNIKQATSEMYQSVFDYPHLSQSANQIFDITWGVRTGGQFATSVVAGTSTDTQAKFNIYDQMAALILGYDQTGSVRVFDVSGNFNSANASSVMDAPVFINVSRLVGKDELKKGSFELKMDLDSWVNPQGFGTITTITDAGSADYENGLRILKETNSNNNVGILDRFRGIAVIQLSSSVVTSLIDDASVSYFVSASSARAWDFEASIHSGTIDELATGLRHRIYNLGVSNLTQLNTTIYTINAGAGDFNYSSNPSYIDNSGQIRIKQTESGDLQKNYPAYAYVTGIGLYAPDGELLAIAKLSRPVKKSEGNPLNLSVKLTY